MTVTSNELSPTPVIISSIGLEDDNLTAVLAAIEFVKNKGITCRYLGNDDIKGHLVILDLESEAGSAAFSKLRPGQVKLVISEKKLTGKNLASLPKPVKAMAIKTLIERICSQIEIQLAAKSSPTKSSPAKAPPEKAEATQGDSHDKQSNEASSSEAIHEETAFHILYDAKCAQKLLKMNVNGYPSVLIHGKGNSLATSATQEQLRVILATAKEAITIEKLEAQDFPSAPSGDTELSPLDSSLWAAGLLWRSGTLINQCGPDQPVKLKAWPNFTRNTFFPEHLSLSAALAVQALSLNKLHETTKVPMDEIICFFNAAYSIGLIDVNPDQSAPPATRAVKNDNKRQGLLSKLAHRFGFGLA